MNGKRVKWLKRALRFNFRMHYGTENISPKAWRRMKKWFARLSRPEKERFIKNQNELMSIEDKFGMDDARHMAESTQE
jgi:hypothetical protein